MNRRPRNTILALSFAALLFALGCGGGGGGTAAGTGTGNGGNPIPPVTPTAQQGVKPSSTISPNGTASKAFARPNPVLVLTVNAECYSGTPQYSWLLDNTTVISGAVSSSLITGKNYVGHKIKSTVVCTDGFLEFPEIYINAGSEFASDNLNNLLQMPLASGGYALLMSKEGYNFVPLLEPGVSMDILKESDPKFWASTNNDSADVNGNFTVGFYETLDQMIVNATLTENNATRGCLKNANGLYDAAGCITANDLIQFIAKYGISDLFFLPAEGKNFDELNSSAVQLLKEKAYLSQSAGRAAGKAMFDINNVLLFGTDTNIIPDSYPNLLQNLSPSAEDNEANGVKKLMFNYGGQKKLSANAGRREFDARQHYHCCGNSALSHNMRRG